MTPEQFIDLSKKIESEVARVIIGQTDVIRHTMIAVISGGHVLLEGLPGLGKTSLVRAFGQTLDLRFSRIQFTPDLMPADIVGTDILEERDDGKRAFRFQAGPIFANLILADEINRATPKTQSALLEAMQERTVTVLGRTYRVEPPFFVLATQNPIEMEGTYPLPEAQLDRFMFKLNVMFPDTNELTTIIENTTSDKISRAHHITDGKTLIEMGQFARQVPAAAQVNRYAAAIVAATHPENADATEQIKKYVRFGSSPRGAQALLLGARVLALLNGRFNVAIDDVRAIAPAALRHRILLNYEGQGEGISTNNIVRDVLAAVKA
ncbi:MAG: MoxR family ATPase [Chloroflexota bacterium]|jgi:MoxR-like ATPase|nr:MoxR family ATPase [Chloroflexota bacterium]